jgi:hypothetical protein
MGLELAVRLQDNKLRGSLEEGGKRLREARWKKGGRGRRGREEREGGASRQQTPWVSGRWG